MAWSDSLLEAKYRGITFDCVSTDDGADRALAQHLCPYLDGADIEDTGRGARAISVEAVFYGEDYESALQAFLAALDTGGAGELQHPVFGAINVYVQHHSVRHVAEDVDQARVSIAFVEGRADVAAFFARELPAQKAAAVATHGDAARSALAQALADAIARLRNSAALAALEDLRTSMLGPLLAGQDEAQSVLVSGLDVLTYPSAWTTDLSSLANGILDTKDFATDVVGDWRAAGNSLRVFDVFFPDTSSATPVAAASTPTEAQAVTLVGAYVQSNSAAAYADAASFVLISEADTPTLSPPEIEAIANTARTRLEAAIVAVRATLTVEPARPVVEALKDQAYAVQEAARSVIEARPPLVARTLSAPGNLRLIAHRWYADHTRAPELARLNPDVRRPNFLQPGDALNAYAR